MSKERFLLDDKDDPWESIDKRKISHALAIRDFMLGPGRFLPDPNETLQKLSEKIVNADVPLDRCVTIVGLLNAEGLASMRVWNKDQGAEAHILPHSPESDRGYRRSPAALAHEHKQWVFFNPQLTEEAAFGIVKELQGDGFTGYICAPNFMANGMHSIFSFATKAKDGFSQEDIAFFKAVFPAIAACQEILMVHRLLKEVTRTYIGEEPHRRVLSGDVRRGEVSRISSAILFADMRDFTQLTSTMTAEETTSLLNTYFDCIVPAIEQNDGEVLKFMGDGILAIFRDVESDVVASNNALKAALLGLQAVENNNACEALKFEVGIALHFGEVAYGNVGSGQRLDYTVIGRDVNLTSRIAGLCGPMGQKLLLSESLKERVEGGEFLDVGEQALKGIAEKQRVFAYSF